MRLDESCDLRHGTRDAIHVPFVVAMLKKQDNIFVELKAGQWVKFTDNTCKEFILSNQHEGHGVINPFIEEIYWFDPVVILLKPGITTPVEHTFEIALNKADQERQELEVELERLRDEDPNCAECYVIMNNKVVRM